MELYGLKSIIVGVYVPTEDKSKFFTQLLNELSSFSYQSWCLMGDWNGVTSPVIDRTSKKQVKIKGTTKIFL